MELSNTEKSLLMYFETCVVDNSGKVQSVRMNDEDFEIAKRWNEQGYVKFGRIKYEDVVDFDGGPKNCWCELTEASWAEAHKQRRERADRLAAKAKYGKVGIK